MSQQFDTLGDAYERSAEDLPFRKHLEQHSMQQAVGDVAGRRVLDLGCGSGLYTRLYAGRGAAEVVGVDTSEGMLETARRHPDNPPTARYVSRNATHPAPDGDPELDGRFDLVSSVYVLCYAAAFEELTGFFTTARRALKTSGGSLTAMTLNPDYGRGPDYFARYGFTLTHEGQGDGSAVTLHSQWPGSDQFSVTAHWWSYAAYERAASAAGFDHVNWLRPTVSEEGVRRYGTEYWEAYLTAPHALILQAH